jgi:uncharacterized protein YneF (UPF0154 family)
MVVALALMVLVVASSTAGFVLGWFAAIRQLPRMMAKMPPSELDALADRVAELRE